MPVVLPDEYLDKGQKLRACNEGKVLRNDPHRESTACTDVKRAGTLKVSKNICAATSRLLLGLSGASVNSTGC